MAGTRTLAKLTAADGVAHESDNFGPSVAIEGDTVVVGAYRDDDGGESDSGSVYVFPTSNSGASYNEVTKLTASNAAENDQFGYSVAIDGGIVVAGAYNKGSKKGMSTGAAYIFSSDDGTNYDQVANVTAADAAAEDYFGISVAIAGGTVVVGTYQERRR